MISLQTLLIIVICAFGGVFVLASLLFAYIYGRHTIKDNPTEALIFVKTGLHINRPIKAKISEKNNKGYSFMYKDKVVFYDEIYYKQKRMFFINRVGQLIATPFNQDVELANDEKESLIYELCSSHIGADGMRALKGKNTVNIVIVAFVAFIIGVIAVFGWNYIQSSLVVSPNTTQQSKPTQPSQTPIQIK